MTPRSRAYANRCALAITLLLGGLVAAGVGFRLGMPGPWMGGSAVAGLSAFAGSVWFGRSLEAARHERNPQ
jgi:hypothetical protein